MTAMTARQLADLEQTGPCQFHSRHGQRNPAGSLYGGQLLCQGLVAAARTLGDGPGSQFWPAHSLHTYFLRSGAADLPIDYTVQVLRNGRRFAARRVEALQGGRLIAHMHCSFHDPEGGFEHQASMPPDVPPPDSLPSLNDYVVAHADRLSPVVVQSYSEPFPLELRLVAPEQSFFARQDRPARAFWLRMPSAAAVADPALQGGLLAFASDHWLAGVAAGCHTLPTDRNRLSIASIDHAIWFHRPTRVDEWLLHWTDSPSARHGRGLARGLLFNQAGDLVATTTQEGIFRSR